MKKTILSEAVHFGYYLYDGESSYDDLLIGVSVLHMPPVLSSTEARVTNSNTYHFEARASAR